MEGVDTLTTSCEALVFNAQLCILMYPETLRTYINYIYLGLLTHRVPILGPFAPTHVGFDEDLIPFGDIYDVERLSEELRWPVLEWRDVKKLKDRKIEPIGGWTIWARYDNLRGGLPRGNHVTSSLGLGKYRPRRGRRPQTH